MDDAQLFRLIGTLFYKFLQLKREEKTTANAEKYQLVFFLIVRLGFCLKIEKWNERNRTIKRRMKT